MSETISKRDKDNDSQGPASEVVDPDDDELDDDLDNALFGDDDDVGDATDADVNARAVEGLHDIAALDCSVVARRSASDQSSCTCCSRWR